MSVFGGFAGSPGGGSDKGLSLGLMQTLKLAWADEDLRQRLLFVFYMFVIYTAGVHIPVPIPGLAADQLNKLMENNSFLQLLNMFSGGGFKRLSIFALGLSPYITASIILQVLTQAWPEWKKELQEGGEYARKKQNRRTRALSLVLCYLQGYGFLQMFKAGGLALQPLQMFTVLTFWTAGSMFCLWLGEKISENGIGNGVSLMIFAGIIISVPTTFAKIGEMVSGGTLPIYKVIFLLVEFVAVTWLVVFFSVAQRRIPIQHMKRNVGTKVLGGQTQYLPLSVNMVGVIPIIFAISLLNLPYQFSTYFPMGSTPHDVFRNIGEYLNPMAPFPKGIVGCISYAALIFFFTYFYTAVQYNVEDISDQLKRSGSFIPGIRPGKQTKDFLDGVISRLTIVGAGFLSIVALLQYVAPALTGVTGLNMLGGTTLLILVSVALETLRQIEANLLMKQYGS